MKLLNEQNLPLADADRYNINKFLNRLLGLPVRTQTAPFAHLGDLACDLACDLA